MALTAATFEAFLACDEREVWDDPFGCACACDDEDGRPPVRHRTVSSGSLRSVDSGVDVTFDDMNDDDDALAASASEDTVLCASASSGSLCSDTEAYYSAVSTASEVSAAALDGGTADLASGILFGMSHNYLSYQQRPLTDVLAEISKDRLPAHPIRDSKAVTYELRNDAVRALKWAAQHCQLSSETVCVAMKLLDRFSVLRADLARYYYIVAAFTCFGLACKLLYETVAVHLSDLAQLLHGATGEAYSVDQLRLLEAIILQAIDFKLTTNTVASVAVTLLPYFAVPADLQLPFVRAVSAVLEAIGADTALLDFAPHLVALAAVRCAVRFYPALQLSELCADGIARVLAYSPRALNEELADLETCVAIATETVRQRLEADGAAQPAYAAAAPVVHDAPIYISM